MARIDHPLLTRARHDGRPCLPVLGEMALALGRAHEVCGAARQLLALAAAAARPGPVLWITPAWMPERLNGEGVTEWIDPGRLVMVHPGRAEDILWCMEEGLRSGAVPLVVAELPEPPPLTPVRRLHLAAAAGAAEGHVAPVGLLATPGAGGAAGVESRWRLEPAHDGADAMRWRLARLRARDAPPAGWEATARRGRDQRHALQLSGRAAAPEPETLPA
jgi:protein ImuA